MQPYPWWTLYLEPPFCVRFGILHLTTWLKWGSLFLFKIQSSKVFENWFFQLLARSWFWWQLVSIQNSSKKSIEKLIFPAFGTILVLVAACFYSKFNSKKVLQIWCFQLLAQSWFQWQLFSSQNSIQKSIENSFSSFWRDLGFGGSFFLQKNCKKIQKGYLLQTRSHTLGEPYT